MSGESRTGREESIRWGAGPKQTFEHGARALLLDERKTDDASMATEVSFSEVLGREPIAEHNLDTGQVLLGHKSFQLSEKNPPGYNGEDTQVAIDIASMRTSTLVVGPPGCGKTHSVAQPIVEHLALQQKCNMASLVVIDPKGDDFGKPEYGDEAEPERVFDFTIDPWSGGLTHGFSLFGGAEDAGQASDRLASALLPEGTPDTNFFVDSAHNALYQILAPFHTAYEGQWPTVRQMIDMLIDPKGSTMQSVRDRLRNQNKLDEFRVELLMREQQRRSSGDMAASLIERLALLDRPQLRKVLDPGSVGQGFEMDMINYATSVRFALPHEQAPTQCRILARLAISQYAQVVSSPKTRREIFKGLVADEASRLLDDYVVGAVRKIRSNNAGMALLFQNFTDIPAEYRQSLFSSAGNKIVFAGLGPDDAEMLSAYYGTVWAEETSVSSGRSNGSGHSTSRHDASNSTNSGESLAYVTSQVERPLWTPSEIINSIPRHHGIVQLSTHDGRRSAPLLTEFRQ